MSKIISATEAAKLVKDGATIFSSGFLGSGVAEEILTALENRFIETQHPKDMTVLFSAAQGDANYRGMNHMAHDGMVKRVIGGHYGLAPKLVELIKQEKVEGYNIPQGIVSHMVRDTAAGKKFHITRIGLDTFVDPRREGAKISKCAKEDIVELMNIDGEEYLKYKLFPVDVAILRGTTADENGNLTMEHETSTLDTVSGALSAKNNGGIVIVQVKRLAKAGTLNTQMVKLPSVLVDYIVVASDEKYHQQTFAVKYEPAMSGELKLPLDRIPPIPLDERKVIARRAFQELRKGANINLGIGLPEGVAAVASEERTIDQYNFSIEAGLFGGVPQSGLNFGSAMNPDCAVDQPYMFDFYHGGGLSYTFLGLAQADIDGNINVSKYSGRISGCGGFIDITQSTPTVTFLGTMTAGGLEVEVKDGKLSILQEGKQKKFIKAVEQITFSGNYARKKKQSVRYITERCVFELKPEGLTLTEIAPGVDLEKDVLAQMEFKPLIAKDLKLMDECIFIDKPMTV